ncbi:Aldo/keto reductase family protein [Actinopolyspora lacussalsi subsp. righensis]|uniref:Aldo/keto reductase family protein n=1 Tax=Actinopolyspora righensis TaxID=995060 RepID=A0A1I7C056_9ACTN|nr:Aldo/keto reductase family protein [Actinopolyspora righensis]
MTEADLRRAHAVHPVAALQEQWSLANRDFERRLLPTAAELGIPVVAHSPNGHGLLHRNGEAAEPGIEDTRAALDEIAEEHGTTAGQVALAWVHHRERVHGVPVVPLPGTTSVSHLHMNTAAAELSLSGEELRRLDAPPRPGDFARNRRPGDNDRPSRFTTHDIRREG